MSTIPIHETLYDLFRSLEDGVAGRLSDQGLPRLGRAQMAVLDTLAGGIESATTVAALARSLDITRQAAHQTVKHLDGLGLISRPEETEADASRSIALSDEGRHLVVHLARATADTERALEERLGIGRMWALRKVFNHLGSARIDLGPPPDPIRTP
jgi:DNA-binding MarR family transcriptional regulator